MNIKQFSLLICVGLLATTNTTLPMLCAGQFAGRSAAPATRMAVRTVETARPQQAARTFWSSAKDVVKPEKAAKQAGWWSWGKAKPEEQKVPRWKKVASAGASAASFYLATEEFLKPVLTTKAIGTIIGTKTGADQELVDMVISAKQQNASKPSDQEQAFVEEQCTKCNVDPRAILVFKKKSDEKNPDKNHFGYTSIHNAIFIGRDLDLTIQNLDDALTWHKKLLELKPNLEQKKQELLDERKSVQNRKAESITDYPRQQAALKKIDAELSKLMKNEREFYTHLATIEQALACHAAAIQHELGHCANYDTAWTKRATTILPLSNHVLGRQIQNALVDYVNPVKKYSLMVNAAKIARAYIEKAATRKLLSYSSQVKEFAADDFVVDDIKLLKAAQKEYEERVQYEQKFEAQKIKEFAATLQINEVDAAGILRAIDYVSTAASLYSPKEENFAWNFAHYAGSRYATLRHGLPREIAPLIVGTRLETKPSLKTHPPDEARAERFKARVEKLEAAKKEQEEQTQTATTTKE